MKKKEKSPWKHIIETPKEGKYYLVSYMDADGDFSSPQLAFWVKREHKFFGFINIFDPCPIVADIYCEVPELPNCKGSK